MMNKYAPEIICLVEIFPKTANFIFAENEYKLQGYNAFITESKKRGAIIFVEDNLLSSANQLTQHIFEESVWCEIHLKNHDKLLLGCIYRSPNSDTGNNGDLINLLREASKKRISHLLIVGDFNCKDIDWESATTQMSPHTIQGRLLDLINTSGWHQHVTQPTRYRDGQLDLVLSTEVNMVQNLIYLNPLGKSDHVCLIFDYYCYGSEIIEKKSPRYYKGDDTTMKKHFDTINWNNFEGAQNTQEKWDFLHNNIIQAVDLFITRYKPKTREVRLAWITNTTLKSIKSKHKNWNRYQKNRSNENWVNYIVARNKASSAVRKAKKEYEYRIAKEIKTNPKCFWNMVREKTKVNEGIQDLQAEDGSTAISDRDKAAVLNKYFASVFTKENLTTIPVIDRPVDVEPIEIVQITEERILKLWGRQIRQITRPR